MWSVYIRTVILRLIGESQKYSVELLINHQCGLAK